MSRPINLVISILVLVAIIIATILLMSDKASSPSKLITNASPQLQAI